MTEDQFWGRPGAARDRQIEAAAKTLIDTLEEVERLDDPDLLEAIKDLRELIYPPMSN